MIIRIQILLKRELRNPDGVAAARVALACLGIEPSACGTASISAAIEEAEFRAVFGVLSEANGSRGLPIPECLKEYAESVSIAPEHIRMTKSRMQKRKE